MNQPCSNPDCDGILKLEYGDRDLYLHLKYLDDLLNDSNIRVLTKVYWLVFTLNPRFMKDWMNIKECDLNKSNNSLKLYEKKFIIICHIQIIIIWILQC